MNNSNNQERYYNILKLNKWFALSSILFTAFWILVFADDFNRPWKKYQIEFRKIEIEKVKQAINLEEVGLKESNEYEDLMNSLSKSRSDLELESGKVDEINNKLESEPELINSDPYGEGWIVKIEISNIPEIDALLSDVDYSNLIG